MLFHTVQFYLSLCRYSLVSHLYRAEFIAVDDEKSNQYYRRYNRRYKKKQGLVKNCWITAGLIIMAFPTLPLIIVLLISTTFLSFSLLDETP